MSNQPVGVAAAIVALVNSVVALLSILNVWSLTTDQVAAVNLVVVNAAIVGTALFARSKVTPTAKP